MDVKVNPQHIIDNLKNQVADKAAEAALNAAVAAAAAEENERLVKSLEDANKEIANLRGTTSTEAVKVKDKED